jgi:hypothetical protein
MTHQQGGNGQRVACQERQDHISLIQSSGDDGSMDNKEKVFRFIHDEPASS